nr:hypothetical protein [Tanacetum cinerariifolium]
YYLFSNRSIADENARLKLELDRTHQEQGRLLVQFDTLTRHLQRIDATDQQLRVETNPIVMGKLTTNNQDYTNAIARGEAAQGTERLSEQLNQARQQIIMLQASLNRPAAAPSGGGGGAAAAPPSPSVSAALRLQIALLQDQVAFANADCLRQRALEKKSRSKERKQLLQESRTAFIQILQAPATDDLKQSIEKTLEPINVELG